MRHYGDITKINGAKVPAVDTVIFGAPCQDLSVAGHRKGMKHGDLGDEETTRSGLFMEAVRIIKEMRSEDERNGRADEYIRPRYAVYENVPGAFSSNKGEDFRIVLEELAKVKDKDAVIPLPDKGKWTNCGCIMGDGWSIAWRVQDAQFWGVPQRRRRIALVADFGGQSAPEILFVRKSVSGNTESSKPKRKEPSSNASGGIGTDDSIGVDIFNTNLTGDKVISLVASGNNSTGYSPKVMTPITTAYTMQDREGCAGGGKGALIQEDKSASLRTNNFQYVFQPVCFPAHGFGNYEEMDATGSLMCGQNQTVRGDTPLVVHPVYSVENHPGDSRVDINDEGIVQTLKSRMGTGGGNVPMVLALDRASFNQGKNAQFDFEVSDKGVNSPLVAKGPGAVCYSTVVLEGNGQRPSHKGDGYAESDKSYTLNATEIHGVCYSIDQGGGKSSVDVREDKAPTLTTTHDGAPAVCYWDGGQVTGTLTANNAGGNQRMPDKENFNCVITRYIVRRLTPLECERLQGYPDGWTDIGEWTDTNGKVHKTSDAARYKALGNSIALPPWKWVLKRICACYERDATMASLFDGIGGFPYLWEQLNGKGTCLWASEIEEFPIAVTKVRIGE